MGKVDIIETAVPRNLLLYLLLLTCHAEARPINLNTSAEALYQTVGDSELGGSSVEVVKCIFARLQHPYQIQFTSLSRARQNVSRHSADGFFSSAPDNLVDHCSANVFIHPYFFSDDHAVFHEGPNAELSGSF